MNAVENQSEAPAIKALGSLCKLTEVYLWDDGAKETRESSCLSDSAVISLKSSRQRDKSRSSIFHSTSDFSTLPEDIELAKEMDALDLPLSFHTNKEARSKNKMTISIKKGVRPKHSHGHKDTEEALEFSQVSEMEIESPSIFHDSSSSSFCCMSMLGQSESSYHDVAVAANKSLFPRHKREDSASLARTICASVLEKNCNGISDLVTNDGQDYDFAQQSGIMSKDDEKIALS
ncbi:hypothetical protein CRYUN_Cryun28dG0083200 [Craigia yunnanensis]